MTKDRFAHIHFYVKGKNDHLILIYSDGAFAEIVAKGKKSRKGACVRWADSEFRHLSRQEAFLRFSDQIERVIIDHPNFRGSWGSWDKFLGWLTRMIG